jgi:hypothetical protein
MISADFTGATWRKSSRSSEATHCVEVAFAPTAWRKSSRSGEATHCVEIAFAPASWHKSTHSSEATACVEVAVTGGAVGVRDSKNTSGPQLVFTTDSWTTLLTTPTMRS